MGFTSQVSEIFKSHNIKFEVQNGVPKIESIENAKDLQAVSNKLSKIETNGVLLTEKKKLVSFFNGLKIEQQKNYLDIANEICKTFFCNANLSLEWNKNIAVYERKAIQVKTHYEKDCKDYVALELTIQENKTTFLKVTLKKCNELKNCTYSLDIASLGDVELRLSVKNNKKLSLNEQVENIKKQVSMIVT